MGLSKLAITESAVTEALTSAESLTNYLEDSSNKSKSLLTKVEGSNWSGETRDAFVAYLTIVEKFHADLYKASKKQPKALKKIPKGIEKYEAHAEVAKVKNL